VKAYESGCCRLSCVACEKQLRARRALAIKERFEAAGGMAGGPVLYTILTVPPALRARAAQEATWTDWKRKIVKWLKKNAGFRFGVERTDPAGDRDRTKWHPHINLLWCQRPGFRPYLDLAKLRTAWAQIIGAKTVNVWHQFSSAPGQLWHWFSYMGRTWPEWVPVVKGHMTVRWYGRYPKSEDAGPACCEKCGEGYVVLRCGSRACAEEMVAAGAAAVRWEVEKQEMFRALYGGGGLGAQEELW
jgi:hypothetical protein